MFPADVKEEDAIILARDMEQKTGIRAFQLDISPQELTSSLTLDDYDEDFNEIEQETDVQQLVADSSGMELYRMRNSFDFNGTYDAVKNVIDALMQDGRRMTVDSRRRGRHHGCQYVFHDRNRPGIHGTGYRCNKNGKQQPVRHDFFRRGSGCDRGTGRHRRR